MAITYADSGHCYTCGWHTVYRGKNLTRSEHKRITRAAWGHMAGTGHDVEVTLVRLYRANAKRKSPYAGKGKR